MKKIKNFIIKNRNSKWNKRRNRIIKFIKSSKYIKNILFFIYFDGYYLITEYLQGGESIKSKKWKIFFY